jgi:hypothetical protein
VREHVGEIAGNRRVHPDVVTPLFRQIPAVLENLVVRLGVGQAMAKFSRDRIDRRLVHVRQPVVCGERIRHVATAFLIKVGAMSVQIVEKTTRLILVGLEAGELQEAPSVMTDFDDTRDEADSSIVGGPEAILIHVEAKLVQSTGAGVEPVAVRRSNDLLVHDLLPQSVIPIAKVLGQIHGVKF